MIFDMTDYDSTLKSLLELLNFTKADKDKILEFVYLESTDVKDFLESFNVEEKDLLEKAVELVSLHSTTSIDDCMSLKHLGIINLQDAVSQDTPLKDYLTKKEIQINIKEKHILYKKNKLDISKKTDGYCLTDSEEYRNRIIDKFYEDFQINGFLYHPNVLSYGGYTKDRPEILLDLANFLTDSTIENDWITHKKKEHFIIKFKQPLNYYKFWTFEAEYEDSYYGVTEDNFEYLSNEIIDLKIKRWLVQKSLYILKDEVYELFSYIHPKGKIEPKDIIEILSEQEYLDKYKIQFVD